MPEEGTPENPPVDLQALVQAIKAEIQPDIEGIKSTFDSRFDRLNNDVEALVTSSKPAASTEVGQKIDAVAERRQSDKYNSDLQNAVSARDEFWQARQEALYEKKLPASAFEGFTTAAEIKRQTAVLETVMGINKTGEDPKKEIKGAGPGNEGETPKVAGLTKTERMAAWLDKNAPAPMHRP